ncbi:MAG: hypothetical protein WC365_08300 [Candidatus Babeliales bacterium]|jgi:hypothetical protein
MTNKKIFSVTIKHLNDESPDISYLETDSEINDDGTLNIISSMRYSSKDVELYGQQQVMQCIWQDLERLENYGNTWYMMGIKASCEIGLKQNKTSHLLQTLTSGGLWGIESDGDSDYFKETETDQLNELKSVLKTFSFSNKAINKAFQTVKKEND